MFPPRNGALKDVPHEIKEAVNLIVKTKKIYLEFYVNTDPVIACNSLQNKGKYISSEPISNLAIFKFGQANDIYFIRNTR